MFQVVTVEGEHFEGEHLSGAWLEDKCVGVIVRGSSSWNDKAKLVNAESILRIDIPVDAPECKDCTRVLEGLGLPTTVAPPEPSVTPEVPADVGIEIREAPPEAAS